MLKPARGPLSHGEEIHYADPGATPVRTGYMFWIEYTLDKEKMTFSANWGPRNGGIVNGVTDLRIVTTSSGMDGKWDVSSEPSGAFRADSRRASHGLGAADREKRVAVK